MADWKYIMYELDEGTPKSVKLPIIFPNTVIHVDVARRLHRVMNDEGKRAAPVVSAGFVSSLVVTGVHGMSESLNGLKSRPTDAETINCMPYNGGRPPMFENMEPMMLVKVVQQLLQRIEDLSS